MNWLPAARISVAGVLFAALLAAAVWYLPLRARAAEAQPPPPRTSAPAPELTGEKWLNTPGDKPLSLAALRGKVVILHFWTFG